MILNNVDFETYFKHYPNNEGYFGKFGGAYVSPELKKAMEEKLGLQRNNLSLYKQFIFILFLCSFSRCIYP